MSNKSDKSLVWEADHDDFEFPRLRLNARWVGFLAKTAVKDDNKRIAAIVANAGKRLNDIKRAKKRKKREKQS